MKFTIAKEPVPYVIIDDFYNQEDLFLIYRELDFLFSKLRDSASTGTNDVPIKNNKGIFLEELYNFREFSDILKVNRKIFSADVADKLIECNYGFKFIRHGTQDTTLISYYGNDEYYGPHRDVCIISAVTWFHKLPKNFTGGDFVFTDYNISIEPKNNRCVLFFSCTLHSVTPIKLINNSIALPGRFSMTQFITNRK
jgi:hypothetical protein